LDDLFSIRNKVIVVTGGGSGLGKAVAISLAQRKALTHSFDKKFYEKVPMGLSDNLFQQTCDITNKQKFDSLIKKIFLEHKKIDVLINIAGIGLKKSGLFYPIHNWKKTLEVNLTAPFNCSQTVIKYMMKNKSGSIINFTSINAELAFPNNPAYVASKGGLKMLSKSLAKDWAKYGIRVNSIGPGYFRTDMTKESYENKNLRQKRTERTLLGRWGNKEDIVGTCIFLASDASNYITGQDIYVDGGWLANGLS
jgi:NAD(P)-dependent dehydrogenase (short-subunit alcohol dehydrogenase family)